MSNYKIPKYVDYLLVLLHNNWLFQNQKFCTSYLQQSVHIMNADNYKYNTYNYPVIVISIPKIGCLNMQKSILLVYDMSQSETYES